MLIKISTTILLAFLFIGCSAKGLDFKNFKEPQKGKSKLYIYENKMGLFSSPYDQALDNRIYLINKESNQTFKFIGTSRSGGFLSAEVDPGNILLGSKEDDNARVEFYIEENDTACIKVRDLRSAISLDYTFELESFSRCNEEIRQTRESDNDSFYKNIIYLGVGAFDGSGSTNITQELKDNYVWSDTGTTEDRGYESPFNSTSYPIKLGIYLENYNRLELVYRDIKLHYSDIETMKAYNLNAIYGYPLFDTQLMLNSGLGIGYWIYEDTESISKNGEELQNFSFHYSLGLLYGISKHLEVEMNYILDLVFWESGSLDSSVTQKIDSNMYGVYFGLNYKVQISN
jgi:opacity protein-like surface antigen